MLLEEILRVYYVALASRMETVLCATSNAAHGILVHDLATGARVHAYKESTSLLVRLSGGGGVLVQISERKIIIFFCKFGSLETHLSPENATVG